jgi:hypothetical protein
MDVKLEDNKKVPALSATSARSGYFAVDQEHIYFEGCRERFATHWNSRTKAIFFKHNPGAGKNIAAFIHKTEKIVNANMESKFALTNMDEVLWVAPSRFWMQCKMKRSLFTILLRAGRNYHIDSDNYEGALFGDSYANKTRQAIMRFLFGYTKYVGAKPGGSSTLESVGWVALTQSSTIYDLKKDFIAPGRKKKNRFHFDLSQEIWS